jgi:protein-disulfide isomerase
MTPKFLAALVVAAGAAVVQPAFAQEDQPFNPRQIEGVRKIVRDYLMEHPEVIGEAIEALREKMRAQAEQDAKKSIEAYKAELFDNKDDPVIGNPKGDVVMVEFFDYNCGFCKQVVEAMIEAAKADGNVKIVLKDFPILTEESASVARLAVASKKQGKYEDFYRALMKYRGRLDDKTALKLAAEAGLNADQLKKDAAAPEVAKQLRRNAEIARALDISGTPAFVVGDRVVSGALEQNIFRQLFAAARKVKTGQN